MASPQRLTRLGIEAGEAVARAVVPQRQDIRPISPPAPITPAVPVELSGPERLRLERLRADIEYTKSVLKSSQIARSAKAVASLATQAGAFLNWWNRLVTAYTVTLGDPQLQVSGDEWWTKAAKPSKENLMLFKKHWDSDLARETRYHDLRVGNAAGRLMYVAKTLGSRAFAYPQDAGFQLGRGMRFGNQYLLERIRYLYDSDEAGKFVNENGMLLVDLPASILIDFGNPIFAGIARAPKAAHDLYTWRQLGKLDIKADIPAMRKFILGAFEGGVDDDFLWQSLHGAWKEGGRPAVKQLLDIAGFTAPGVLGTLQLSWLRRPGKAYSAAQAKLLFKHRDAMMRADDLTRKVMETSEPLMEFLQTARPEELLQFTKLAYEKKSVAQVAGEIMESRRTMPSERAFNAWKEFKKVAEHEMLERSKLWPEDAQIVLRNTKAQRLLDDFFKRAGKAAPDIKEFEIVKGFIPDNFFASLNKFPDMKFKAWEDGIMSRAEHASAEVYNDVLHRSGSQEQAKQSAARVVDASRRFVKFAQNGIRELAGLPIGKGGPAAMESAAITKSIDVLKKSFVMAEGEYALLEKSGVKHIEQVLGPERAKTLSAVVDKIYGVGDFLKKASVHYETGRQYIHKGTGEALQIPRQLEIKILRLQADSMPPTLRDHYWRSILNEAKIAEPGKHVNLDDWYTRWRRELNWKNDRLKPEDYAAKVEDIPTARLRDAWKTTIETLASRPARDVSEASWKQFRDGIDRELSLVKSSAAEEYGGKLNQQRLMAGLEDFKELAERAATPQDKQYVNRILGTITTAVKSGKLLFPPFGWQMFNLVENTAKNIAEFGWDQTFRMPSMGSKIGTVLDFTSQTPKQIFSDPNKGYTLMNAPGLKWYNRYLVQPVNDRISRFSSNVPGAWSYHDALRNIETNMPGIPAEEAHRLATRQAMDRVSATQFNVDHISPALEFLERFGALAPAAGIPVHSVFASFWTDTIRFWMGKAIEHPVAAHALYKLEDAVKEHSISGDGKLYVPGTGIKLDPGPGLTYRNLIDIMERTKPIEIGDTISETAVKILRSADSGAAAFLRESSYAPSLQRMVKGDNIGLNADISTLPTNVQRQDALHRISGEFYGLNSAVKAVTGQDILNYFAFREKLAPEAKTSIDEKIRRGMAVEQRAAWMRGEYPDNEELMHRYFQSEKTKGILAVFGLSGKHDPDGIKTAIENVRDTYYKQPGYDQREQMRNHLVIETPGGPKPLLDVIAARPEHIPDAHPQKEFLNRFRDVKDDPAKSREVYNEASNDQKRGILENFVDWWKNVQFKNPFVSEAGGAEFGHDDIPISKPDMERLQRQLPDPRLGQGFLPAPQVMEGNTLRFFREDLFRPKLDASGKPEYSLDPYFTKKISDENARYNGALRAFATITSATISKKQWDDAFTKGIEISIKQDGSPDIMPIKIFMDKPVSQGAQTYLYRALNATMNMGTLIRDPKNPDAPPKQTTFFYDGAKDILNFLASNGKRYPQRLEIAESRRIQQENRELIPFRDQMLQTLNPNNGKSAAELEARFKVETGKPGGPPKDLYRRLMNQGDYSLVSRFALQADADPRLLEPFKSIVYSFGRHDLYGQPQKDLNEGAMDFLVTSGHLHELQLLGLSDPRIARYVKERWPDVADITNIERESMSSFLHRNQVPVTSADVTVSGGIIPAWIPAAEKPKPGVGVLLPVAAPTPTLISGEHVAQRTSTMPAYVMPQVLIDTSWAWDPVPQRGFYSTTAYVNHSINAARNYNARISMAEPVIQKDLGRPDYVIPRQNFFGSALHYLPQLDPAVAAHGAAGIMGVANRLGMVGNDELTAIYTGMNEQALVGAGINVATNVLSVANNLMGGMSQGDRLARMSSPTMPVPGGGTVPNPNYSPGMVATAQYGGTAGSLLTFGAGVNEAAGGPKEASIAMGAAGGALSGAAMGTMVLPGAGTIIGAAIGGAVGGLTAAFGGGGGRRGERPEYAQMQALQRQEMEERRATMRAMSLRETQRALNVAFAGGRMDTRRHVPAILEYMRRPTFASSQGLVRSVEASIFKTLQARW